MNNIYLDHKNEQPMNEIYVVLSKDTDGCEGIVSAFTGVGAMPMVFGHARMLEPIKDILKTMSKDTGRTLIIAKFTKTEILETISTTN